MQYAVTATEIPVMTARAATAGEWWTTLVSKRATASRGIVKVSRSSVFRFESEPFPLSDDLLG